IAWRREPAFAQRAPLAAVDLVAVDLERQAELGGELPGDPLRSVRGAVVHEDRLPLPPARAAAHPIGHGVQAPLDPPALVITGNGERSDFGFRVSDFGSENHRSQVTNHKSSLTASKTNW